jgi:hypothetical protein
VATNTVQEGVEVYDCDGKKLGKVRHFFSAATEASPEDVSTGPELDADARPTDQNETLTPTPMERVDSGTDASSSSLLDAHAPLVNQGMPASGEVPRMSPGMGLGPSDTKYMEVHHGGILHIGGESLYIPVKAVNTIEDDGSIVLRCTADEATQWYAQKPEPLYED